MNVDTVKALRNIASKLNRAIGERAKELDMLDKLASTLKQASMKLVFALNKSDPATIQNTAKTLGLVSDQLQAFVNGKRQEIR